MSRRARVSDSVSFGMSFQRYQVALVLDGIGKKVSLRPMDVQMTTTAFAVEGYRIVRSLGVVRGITVRSRSVFGTIGGSLQTLIGGNLTLFTQLCEHARQEAFEIMCRHADEM